MTQSDLFTNTSVHANTNLHVVKRQVLYLLLTFISDSKRNLNYKTTNH